MTTTPTRALPATIRICFAHAAHRLAERFALRNTGIDHFQVSNLDDLQL